MSCACKTKYESITVNYLKTKYCVKIGMLQFGSAYMRAATAATQFGAITKFWKTDSQESPPALYRIGLPRSLSVSPKMGSTTTAQPVRKNIVKNKEI